MRICDKCGKRHAWHKVRQWDICETCLELLNNWFKRNPDPDYHIEEILNKDGTVKSRKLMLGNEIVQDLIK